MRAVSWSSSAWPLPAIFEELAFRGVLQPLLIRATGHAFWGIVLASIIFSAIHFQFYGFLPRVLLGALFGWLAYRSGSLLPGMLAHFVNNALAAVTLWVTGSMADDLMDLTPMVVGASLVLTAVSHGGPMTGSSAGLPPPELQEGFGAQQVLRRGQFEVVEVALHEGHRATGGFPNGSIVREMGLVLDPIGVPQF